MKLTRLTQTNMIFQSIFNTGKKVLVKAKTKKEAIELTFKLFGAGFITKKNSR